VRQARWAGSVALCARGTRDVGLMCPVGAVWQPAASAWRTRHRPAQPSVLNDGKVNVTVTVNGQEIGVIRDVTLTNAESLATSACGNAGITADALKALDANGAPVPGTCAGVDGGPTFTFAQNTPGESPPASSSSTTATTTTLSAR
jgi:hypothetical protein